jgi:hypothetical protein
VLSLLGVFWFGSRMKAGDESRFMGIVFLLSVAWILVVWGNALYQSLM